VVLLIVELGYADLMSKEVLERFIVEGGPVKELRVAR
jgi:hypothetical protein